MCCPSYLYFFYFVVINNINQQRPTSNPVPHTWSKPQHNNIIKCKTYKKVIKRVESSFKLAKFCWQKRKTDGKLINGHIEHDISFRTKNSFNIMWNPNAKNCYQEWTVQYWVLMHKALSVWEDDPTNNKGTCRLPTHRTAFNIACLMVVMRYVRCVTWLLSELEYTGIAEDSLWCLLVYWCLFGARSFTTIIMALPGLYSQRASSL